ncbi:MAG: VOC family protein [Thaumarchaeota archaeon]|nr:VOC family protein [Nitrososphaerota archaeon]
MYNERPRSVSNNEIQPSNKRALIGGVKELGHVVLYVGDLEMSRQFYSDILGFNEIPRIGDTFAVFSSGRTHHELLLIQVGTDANPIPPEPRIGLYHIGLKVGESDDELRGAVARLKAAGIEIEGMADHTVTHSVYIKDPDGNEIELYIDVQPAIWQKDPKAIVAPTRPLRL